MLTVNFAARALVPALALFVGFAACNTGDAEAPANNAPERTSTAPVRVSMVRKGEAKTLSAGGPHIDWNVATTSPVKAAPAVAGTSFSAGDATDVFAFAVSNTGTARGINGSGQLNAGWATAAADAGIFVLTNLYNGALKPDLLTYALDNVTAQAVTGGGLVFNISGSKLYALTSAGTLYCFAVPAGGAVGGAATRASACSGWTNYTSSTVSRSTIWPIYDGNGDVTHLYFGTDNGRLHKVDGSTGATAWGAAGGALATTTAQLGPPVVYTESATTNVVLIADNIGRYFRYVDTGSTPTTSTPSYDLCGGAPGSCATANWGVLTSPAVDLTQALSYVASGGRLFEFPISSTATWAPNNTSKVLVASPTAQMYSNPILDPDNLWAYLGYDNKLYKVKYPFDGSSSTNIYSTSVQKAGADASYPRAQPLPYLSQIWIGTGDGTNGLAEQYGCGSTSNALAPSLIGQSALTYGAYIGTPMVFDFLTGNVNFGYQNAAGTAGGAVQYVSAIGGADWVCPSGQAYIAGLSCGSTGCGSGCSVPGDCPGTNQATVTCTAPTCGGTCNAGYADCNSNKNSDGCETNTTNDVSNCGGCGTVCSTTNIYTPTCTASVCGGACNVNYYDCNANNADGCEGSNTCADCCGVTCSGGTPMCSAGVCKAIPGTTTVSHVVANGTNGSGSANQAIGMDFDVVSSIVVTELGVFDDSSDGLKRDITAYIYNRDTQALVTSLVFASGTGTLSGGSRFASISCPVVLPAGFRGTIVADGYAGPERYGDDTTPAWTTDTGGGLVTYTGTSRTGTTGTFPGTTGTGPVNQYAAGTFKFAAAP